ncbi:MAG: hypothetical protein QXI91_06535 [Candidatus Bathyarchaeia archaeon]
MNKKAFAISFLLLSLLLISNLTSVFALDEWQEYTGEGYPSGTWDFKSRTYWRSGDNWEALGKFCYIYSSSLSFTMWDLKVKALVETYGSYSLVCQYIKFKINDLEIRIKYEKGIVGSNSICGDKVFVSKIENLTELEMVYSGVTGFDLFRLQIYRCDNNTMTVRIAVFDRPEDTEAISIWQRNYTLGQEWLDNAKTITQEVSVERDDSKGYIEGEIITEQFMCNGLTIGELSIESTMNYWELLRRGFWHLLTSAYQGITSTFQSMFGWAGQLYEWIAFCFTFVGGIVYCIVHTSLPFFPLILLFWFLDAMMTSVQEGNLQPIGHCFMTIYDFLRAVIQTIVNIASAIWDYINPLG